ncbi:MAG: hypothetical protein QW343_01365 [Candidatus Norongarragalinales archaeon]
MTRHSNLLLIEGKRKGPDFVAKVPVQNNRWLEVGVAFYNPKTQSITLYFDALPVGGKIVLFKPKH